MFIGTLLPYQVEAVDKMIERRQVLVAYDLGLGKTVLTIAAIEALRKSGDISGPTRMPVEPEVSVGQGDIEVQRPDVHRHRRFEDQKERAVRRISRPCD
jgi:tRNA A37 threonylcarbamoyladenosine biosynthesis protein TsaE